MRELDQADVDRLMRSDRHLTISMVVFLVLAVVGLVVLIAVDMDLRLTPLLGVLIGTVMLLPQQALLREMGLSRPQARAIIQAEKARRNPKAYRPLAEEIKREWRLMLLWQAVTLVSVGVVIASVAYLVPRLGATTDESAPTDHWFAISFFAGIAAAVVGCSAFLQSRRHSGEVALLRRLAVKESGRDGHGAATRPDRPPARSS